MKRNISLTAAMLAVLVLSLAATAFAITVSPGQDPLVTERVGAVRFRGLPEPSNYAQQEEVYLGVPDLGVAGNRVQKDLLWDSENEILFQYDAANDLLRTMVSNPKGSWTLEYPDFSSNVTAIKGPAGTKALQNLNYMEIVFAKRMNTDQTTIEFNKVDLITPHAVEHLGNFTAGSGWTYWNVKDIDLSNGFTLQGVLRLSGPADGWEHNKMELLVGNVIPEPATMLLFSLGVLPAAFMLRRKN